MPEVRHATADELPEVGRVLAAAFADDPVWQWMSVPTPHWARRAARWFTAEATAAHRGHGQVLVDDSLRGAAIWSPPRRWRSDWREVARVALPSLALFRTRLTRAVGVTTHLERVHPVEPPHWYLALLGTDPAHQGHGVGGDLVGAVTERCDAEGLPAYLESSKEQNLGFYARHGFVPAEAVRPGGGPALWPMWREPRA